MPQFKTSLNTCLRHGPNRRWMRVFALLGCLFGQPLIAAAQAPGTQPNQGHTPTDAGIDQVLARAQEVIKKLEDTEHDPDQRQDEQEAFIEVTKLVERVLEIDPINKTAGYLNGRLSILGGRPRAALPMIEEYVNDSAGRNDWLAYKFLGDLYVTSFPKLAVDKYRRSITLAENEPDAIIGLARAYLRLNTPKQAIENAERAILLDKEDDATYRATLAEALRMDKSFEDAARAASAAVKMSEDEIARKPSQKLLLNELKAHYDLHLECVSDLADLYPEQAEFVLQLARIWQDKSDLDRVVSYHQAIVMLERARTNPNLVVTSELLYEQARLNRLVLQNDEAMRILQELLTNDADFAPALELQRIIEGEGSVARKPAASETTAP